jgi:hypothetical protein
MMRTDGKKFPIDAHSRNNCMQAWHGKDIAAIMVVLMPSGNLQKAKKIVKPHDLCHMPVY